MLTEDYCSYEVAKLLKEKGFAEECVACYDWVDNGFRTIYHDTTGEVEPQDWNNLTFEEAGKMGLASWNRNISAPTHQMAMKWLRENKGLFINIGQLKCMNAPIKYRFSIWKDVTYIGKSGDTGDYPTYEEAVEAALKYCLTNLIH